MDKRRTRFSGALEGDSKRKILLAQLGKENKQR
jgi:hypothetical protein